MKKSEFKDFLQAVVRCYDASTIDKLPTFSSFPEHIFDSNEQLNIDVLTNFAVSSDNKYLSSVTSRILASINILNSRNGKGSLDINYNWMLIAQSILLIPEDEVVASVGSQGFVSIPIYKCDNIIENFEFIRLHIWDETLNEFIDQEKRNHFSIHSHKFHAHSWIICGKVMNDRFLVDTSNDWMAQSLFSIEYNESINQVNRHTSCAKNTGVFVRVKQVSHELYLPHGSYEIKAGDYHKSNAKQEGVTSATFFVFTAAYGLVDKSYVVGSSDIQSSEINRTLRVNAIDLLHKINAQTNNL